MEAGNTDSAAPELEGKPSRLRWVVLGILVLVVGLAFLARPHETWAWFKENQASLERQINEHLFLAATAAFVVYALVAGLSLPFGVWMTVACGVLFGRWLGLAIVSFGSTTGATLALLMFRFLLRDWARRRYGTRLEAIDRGIERSGAYYLLMLRLNPFIPYFLINAALGLTRIRVVTFWVVSQLGMLPLTFLYLNAAAAVAEVERPTDLISPRLLLYLALASLTPLVLRQVFQGRGHTMATSDSG